MNWINRTKNLSYLYLGSFLVAKIEDRRSYVLSWDNSKYNWNYLENKHLSISAQQSSLWEIFSLAGLGFLKNLSNRQTEKIDWLKIYSETSTFISINTLLVAKVNELGEVCSYDGDHEKWVPEKYNIAQTYQIITCDLICTLFPSTLGKHIYLNMAQEILK